MSGMQQEYPIGEIMTQEEIDKMQKAFAEQIGEHVDELKNLEAKPANSNKDYTVRRKRIYKGKMSPTGFIYIVIKVQTKTGSVEAHQRIQGGQDQKVEDEVAESLRELIRTKHGI